MSLNNSSTYHINMIQYCFLGKIIKTNMVLIKYQGYNIIFNNKTLETKSIC